MANFLVPIDLHKNELQNARIQNLAAAPVSPVEGQIYLNTTDHAIYYYNGTAWTIIGTGTGHNPVTLTTAADVLLGLSGQQLDLDTQTQNKVLAAPVSSTAAPTFRILDPLDIPSLAHTKISDFDAGVQSNTLNQMAAPTADLSIGSHKLTNVTDPTSAQDAATKNYVDSVAQGLDIKPSVLCATTANITLSGTQTIDTVAVVAGDRVLVKNQTTVNQNGIYVVAAGAWSRATDSDSWAKLPGAFTFVEKGSQADTGWASTVDAGGTLGVTDVTFVQFSGAGSITAGNGLSQSGTTISMRTPGTLTATSTNQANGTDHTHAIDATIARTSHTHTGMTTKYATTIVGTGAATTFDITHNLNTEDVITQVRLSANADPVAVYDFVEVDIQVRTVNMLRITFAVAPTNSEYYRVIVIG